jgi:hypothetical protein
MRPSRRRPDRDRCGDFSERLGYDRVRMMAFDISPSAYATYFSPGSYPSGDRGFFISTAAADSFLEIWRLEQIPVDFTRSLRA